MSEELVGMFDEDGVVYSVYEDENGETREEISGYLDENEDSDAGYVDHSGNYD